MKQCHNCHESKPLSDFHKNKNQKDGYQPRCKVCMKVAYNLSRNKKKDHYNAVKRNRQRSIKKMFDDWKSENGCQHCSEDDPCCLDLHHTDPSTKEDAVGNLIARSNGWESIMVEANKCVVLCRNCHAKTHAGRGEYDKYLQTKS